MDLISYGSHAFFVTVHQPPDRGRWTKTVFTMKKVSITAARAFIVALFAFWCQISVAQFYQVGDLEYLISSQSKLECSVSKYRGSSSNVVIPSSVVINDKAYTVSSVGYEAFMSNTIISSVVISDGIQAIDGKAFCNCTNLTYIDIPESVTKIGSQSFSGCTSLSSIVIPESVSTIEGITFMNCTNLTSIVIPNSITSIEASAFYGCINLTNIDIPESVVSIGSRAFAGCKSLENFVIPKGVKTLGYETFLGCTSLLNIELPESLTVIEQSVFRDCSRLEEIIIPNEVTGICMYAFSGCSSLRHIYISDSVSSIGERAFDGCTNLKSLTLPNSITRIERYTFKNSGIENLSLPNRLVSIDEYAFADCRSLRQLSIPESLESVSDRAFTYSGISELYLPFDLPADYDVEFTAQSVYVPLGCKAGYVANIQKNNPEYTGENVKELDFDAQSFAINAAEGYGTYYTDRPFVMPEGVEGGVVTPGDAEGVMRVDYRYAAGDVVPARTGLVLKGEPGTYAYESKYFYEAPAAPAGNLLSGTVQQTVLPEDDAVAYYMLSYDREGADLGFYWGAEDGGPFTNGAHRAYLALPRGEAALAKAFVLDGDHLATGIGDVTSPAADAPATVYTLSGTKVTTPVDQLPRGLYIINGKKVFVPGK